MEADTDVPTLTPGSLKAVCHFSISSPDPLLLQVIGVKRLECRGDANRHKLIVSDSSNHMTAIMSGDVCVFDLIEVTKFEHKVHEVHGVHRNVLVIVAFTSISSHHSDVIGSPTPTPCNDPLDAAEPYDSDESIDDWVSDDGDGNAVGANNSDAIRFDKRPRLEQSADDKREAFMAKFKMPAPAVNAVRKRKVPKVPIGKRKSTKK